LSAAPPILRNLAFLAWYAWQELFQRRSRATTLALVLSVACATAAATLAMAVPDITAAIRLDRLAKTPLARCIWLDDARSAKFGEARVALLRGRIDAIRDPGVAEYELVGFHDVTGVEFAALDAGDTYREPTGAPSRPAIRSPATSTASCKRRRSSARRAKGSSFRASSSRSSAGRRGNRSRPR